MEYFDYLTNFGKFIKNLRTSFEPKMSQIDFYSCMIPNSCKEDENIKKKMNKIEHGKEKNIDIELLAAIQNKFHFSLDYIFGLTKDYTNYDNKHYCEYFGLNEKSINNLHQMAINKDFNETNEKFVFSDKNSITEYSKKISDKEDSLKLLQIIDYILQEDTNLHPEFSNISILYMIYNYCFLGASALESDLQSRNLSFIRSTDDVIYPISANDMYLQIIKDKIIWVLDNMRNNIQTIEKYKSTQKH